MMNHHSFICIDYDPKMASAMICTVISNKYFWTDFEHYISSVYHGTTSETIAVWSLFWLASEDKIEEIKLGSQYANADLMQQFICQIESYIWYMFYINPLYYEPSLTYTSGCVWATSLLKRKLFNTIWIGLHKFKI